MAYRLTKSPIQKNKLRSPQQNIDTIQQFLEMGKEVLAARDEMKALKDEITAKLGSIQRGRDGMMGPPGRNGRDGKDGRDGRDGKTPLIDPEKIARMAAAMNPTPKPPKQENKKIKVQDVEGISEALQEMLNKHKTYVHGGGDTVTAGTNIVITTDADGSKVINALGGTSGVNIETQYSLTVVQSGSDITVDLTQLTHWADFSNIVAVYLNNVPQTETINFTVSGSTLTILNAADTDIVNISYAYNP